MILNPSNKEVEIINLSMRELKRVKKGFEAENAPTFDDYDSQKVTEIGNRMGETAVETLNSALGYSISRKDSELSVDIIDEIDRGREVSTPGNFKIELGYDSQEINPINPETEKIYEPPASRAFLPLLIQLAHEVGHYSSKKLLEETGKNQIDVNPERLANEVAVSTIPRLETQNKREYYKGLAAYDSLIRYGDSGIDHTKQGKIRGNEEAIRDILEGKIPLIN